MVTPEKPPEPAGPGPWAIVAVLAIAAFFYLCQLPRTYVGFYGDDADYILTALALVHGHLHALRWPGLPLLHSHWPGFSLILVPAVLAARGHWVLLKAVPFVCVLSCAALVWNWTRLRYTWAVALGITALFAWNPETIERTGAVMSEPIFLMILLIILLLLDRGSGGAKRRWLLGIVAAAAALIRPEGVLLALAISAAIYLWGEERDALAALVPTAILVSVYLSLRAAGWISIPGYWSDWLQNLDAIRGTALFDQLGAELLTLFAGIFFQMPLPHSRVLFLGGILLTSGGLLVALLGLRELWRDPARRVETAALTFFSFLYFVFHILWPVVDARFLWPLLPILLCAIYSGLTALKVRGAALGVLLALLLISYGQPIFATLHSAPAEGRLPQESLGWMGTHLEGSDRVLTTNPSMIYLYTGLPAIGLEPAILHDPATFFYGCQMHHITTLVYLPEPPAHTNVPTTDALLGQWNKSRDWASARLYAFEKMFAAGPEGVAIYHVKPNPAYLQAYALYLSAMADLLNNKPVWANAKLQEAIREDPEFPEAHTAYALVLMATHGSKADAERALKQALRLDPTNSQALLAISRLRAISQ